MHEKRHRVRTLEPYFGSSTPVLAMVRRCCQVLIKCFWNICSVNCFSIDSAINHQIFFVQDLLLWVNLKRPISNCLFANLQIVLMCWWFHVLTIVNCELWNIKLMQFLQHWVNLSLLTISIPKASWILSMNVIVTESLPSISSKKVELFFPGLWLIMPPSSSFC